MDYYASEISPNLGKTPEGFLIATDCVIGRSGFQTYAVGELPQDSLEELGIDASNKTATIDIYRSEDEVFAPETLSSFEGKSVTNEHPNGTQFVEPSNISDLEFGHVQNVRRGDQPLDSGDWPLLGDLIIKREPLLSLVESGRKRSLSCGYDYVLARDGDKIAQVAIRGNHVAVVPKGRAGAEARIKDSAAAVDPVIEVKPQSEGAGLSSTGKEGKETTKVAKPNGVSWISYLLGLGLKAHATDSSPQEVAEAVEGMTKEKAKDDFPDEKDKKEKEAKEAEDRKRAADAEEAEGLCKAGEVAYDDKIIEEGDEEWLETISVEETP